MPQLLVNADDFGLHADIDRGILDCIEGEVLQSLSFCPNGKAIDWNKLRLLSLAGVRVGLHVTLVGEPWLTDGRVVADWKALVKQVLTGGRPFRELVAREVHTQVSACRNNGVRLSHIDSHQHVHIFPGVWAPCYAVAKLLKIRIRVPYAPTTDTVKKNLSGLGLQTLAAIRTRTVPDFLPCLGLSLAGHNTTDILIGELTAAAAGDTNRGNLELVMHPGVNTPDLERAYASWNFDWTAERNALLDPRFTAKMNDLGYTFIAPAEPLGSSEEAVTRIHTNLHE